MKIGTKLDLKKLGFTPSAIDFINRIAHITKKEEKCFGKSYYAMIMKSLNTISCDQKTVSRGSEIKGIGCFCRGSKVSS